MIWRVYVGNRIDYNASYIGPLWLCYIFAVMALHGPCRSGGADFYRVDVTEQALTYKKVS